MAPLDQEIHDLFHQAGRTAPLGLDRPPEEEASLDLLAEAASVDTVDLVLHLPLEALALDTVDLVLQVASEKG